ncbi:cytochrome C domain-containing protein [Rhizoctonia solani AG-1 IA]|uniref:Cytochrome C domain-containing protein n=1 Tax=Thanatephorus cucumeris (strain AG1-IA) TaxID=983506 RepID=L8X004_THACA|nr:cytochrome C domain-containing protein [Rhizoctonia solani AG-1 IA]
MVCPFRHALQVDMQLEGSDRHCKARMLRSTPYWLLVMQETAEPARPGGVGPLALDSRERSTIMSALHSHPFPSSPDFPSLLFTLLKMRSFSIPLRIHCEQISSEQTIDQCARGHKLFMSYCSQCHNTAPSPRAAGLTINEQEADNEMKGLPLKNLRELFGVRDTHSSTSEGQHSASSANWDHERMVKFLQSSSDTASNGSRCNPLFYSGVRLTDVQITDIAKFIEYGGSSNNAPNEAKTKSWWDRMRGNQFIFTLRTKAHNAVMHSPGHTPPPRLRLRYHPLGQPARHRIATIVLHHIMEISGHHVPYRTASSTLPRCGRESVDFQDVKNRALYVDCWLKPTKSRPVVKIRSPESWEEEEEIRPINSRA